LSRKIWENPSRIGFRFRLDSEGVKGRFEAEPSPDPAAVSPLLDLVRQHKEDGRFFLKCHCPRCAGGLFGTFKGCPGA